MATKYEIRRENALYQQGAIISKKDLHGICPEEGSIKSCRREMNLAGLLQNPADFQEMAHKSRESTTQ